MNSGKQYNIVRPLRPDAAPTSNLSPTFYFHSIALSSGNFLLFVLCLFSLLGCLFCVFGTGLAVSDGAVGARHCTTVCYIHRSFSDAKKWLVIRKRRSRGYGFVRLIGRLVVLRDRGAGYPTKCNAFRLIVYFVIDSLFSNQFHWFVFIGFEAIWINECRKQGEW